MNPSNEHASIPVAEMQAWRDTIEGYGEEIKGEVLDDLGFALTGEAQTTAPVDGGDLKASHYVDAFDGKGVTIGAGGGAVDYAWPVHETHATKAQWFLEAINAHFNRIIRGAIEIALSKRGMS